MHADFVDRVCAGLPGAVATAPFGPGMRVWTVGGRMFAGLAAGGHGVSVACPTAMAAQRLVQEGRALSAPYLRGPGWALLPWEAHSADDLRRAIHVSYRTVRRALPAERAADLPAAVLPA